MARRILQQYQGGFGKEVHADNEPSKDPWGWQLFSNDSTNFMIWVLVSSTWIWMNGFTSNQLQIKGIINVSKYTYEKVSCIDWWLSKICKWTWTECYGFLLYGISVYQNQNFLLLCFRRGLIFISKVYCGLRVILSLQKIKDF